jgi:hypothetical protein
LRLWPAGGGFCCPRAHFPHFSALPDPLSAIIALSTSHGLRQLEHPPLLGPAGRLQPPRAPPQPRHPNARQRPMRWPSHHRTLLRAGHAGVPLERQGLVAAAGGQLASRHGVVASAPKPPSGAAAHRGRPVGRAAVGGHPSAGGHDVLSGDVDLLVGLAVSSGRLRSTLPWRSMLRNVRNK